MPHRARRSFALALALLALAMQCCLPLAHAAHAASHVKPDAHDRAHHHHHHDHDGADQDGPDESECPTCQQFALLRTAALPAAPVVVGCVDFVDVDDAPACGGPLITQVRYSPAAPRGPPAA